MTNVKGQQSEYQLLPVKNIKLNIGQIPGLPRNPRLIRDSRFEQLKRSIQEFPEMLQLREVIVFPHKRTFVAICGNMRVQAMRELEITEAPAKVLSKNFPIEKLAELAVKDNISFGENDFEVFQAEWSQFPVTDWGLDFIPIDDINLEEFFTDPVEELKKPESFTIVLNFVSEKQCEKVKKALNAHGETFEAAVCNLLNL